MTSGSGKVGTNTARFPPHDVYYPSKPAVFAYKLKNYIHHWTFPFSPLFVSASEVVIAGALVKFPESVFNVPGKLVVDKVFRNTKLVDHDLILKALAGGVSAGIICQVVVSSTRLFLRRYVFSYTGFLFEDDPKHISWQSKAWMLFVQLVTKLGARPMLHSYDWNLLPSPPLPTIDETVDNYLESVEPILSPEEFSRAQELAADFRASTGRKLQRYLWLKSLVSSNWVTDWWTQYAYLYARESVMMNCSIGYMDIQNPVRVSPAARGANSFWVGVQHMLRIHSQKVPPLLNNGVPLGLCFIDQAYGTCRVPGEQIDRIEHYELCRHMVVFTRGCWYRVNCCDVDGRMFSPREMEMIFQTIIDREADPLPGEYYINHLTMTDRTTWAQNRQKFFLNDPVNAASLHEIESAILTGCYRLNEDEIGQEYNSLNEDTMGSIMGAMLTDKEGWLDKSFNNVIYGNGRSGGIIEHAWGDGCEFGLVREPIVRDDFLLGYQPDGHCHGKVYPGFDPHSAVKRLEWNVTKEMETAIDSAVSVVRSEVSDLDVASLMFSDYGKGAIKSLRLSPDAWMQIAMQLAFFRKHEKFVLTYESASARFWKNGRTETYRVVTKESCAFVRAMCDSSTTDADRRRLLSEACARHSMGNRKALAGHAPDRHLFALYCLSVGTGNRSPFLDLYVSQKWTLSTSQGPVVTKFVNEDKNPNLRWLGACFGPVDHAGYGILYRPSAEDMFLAHISCRKSARETNAGDLRDLLRRSLQDMMALMKPSS